jgi:hypothetical protein
MRSGEGIIFSSSTALHRKLPDSFRTREVRLFLFGDPSIERCKLRGLQAAEGGGNSQQERD